MPKISWEGTIGLLLEIVVGISDHLHIQERLIVWGLFVLGLVLLSDAVIRSQWASRSPDVRMRLRNRVLGMLPIIVGAIVFGVVVRGRERSKIGTGTESQAKAVPVAPNGQSIPSPTPQKPHQKEQRETAAASSKQNNKRSNSRNVGNLTQGAGSIAQIGGTGNIATVNNIDTHPHITMNDAQQSAITVAMKGFSGRKAIILSNGATPEQVDFGKRMQAALQAAGIQAEFHTGFTMSEGGDALPWLFIGWGERNPDMANALIAVVRDARVVLMAHVGIHYYADGEKDGFQIIVGQPN
jgi:hypothetical protein